MNYLIEHAIGLIIIGLLVVDIYLKRVLYVKLDKIFTEKVEKPVKADMKLQRRAETKADEALKVKNIEEIFIDHE